MNLHLYVHVPSQVWGYTSSARKSYANGIRQRYPPWRILRCEYLRLPVMLTFCQSMHTRIPRWIKSLSIHAVYLYLTLFNLTRIRQFANRKQKSYLIYLYVIGRSKGGENVVWVRMFFYWHKLCKSTIHILWKPIGGHYIGLLQILVHNTSQNHLSLI